MHVYTSFTVYYVQGAIESEAIIWPLTNVVNQTEWYLWWSSDWISHWCTLATVEKIPIFFIEKLRKISCSGNVLSVKIAPCSSVWLIRDLLSCIVRILLRYQPNILLIPLIHNLFFVIIFITTHTKKNNITAIFLPHAGKNPLYSHHLNEIYYSREQQRKRNTETIMMIIMLRIFFHAWNWILCYKIAVYSFFFVWLWSCNFSR